MCSCDRRTGASRNATGIKARPKGRCVQSSIDEATACEHERCQQTRRRSSAGGCVVLRAPGREGTRRRSCRSSRRPHPAALGRRPQLSMWGHHSSGSSNQCGAVVEWAAVVSPRWVCIVLAPSCVLATKKLTFGYGKHHACGCGTGIDRRDRGGRQRRVCAQVIGSSSCRGRVYN